jgi:hypothetical protein
MARKTLLIVYPDGHNVGPFFFFLRSSLYMLFGMPMFMAHKVQVVETGWVFWLIMQYNCGLCWRDAGAWLSASEICVCLSAIQCRYVEVNL